MSNPTPTFIPTFPFAEAPGNDAILRSSDGVDFHVRRAILTLVSSFFDAMFSMPQPVGSPEIPIISVQEDSARLDRALRFFYPGAYVKIDTIEELRDVMEILVSKYDAQGIVPQAKQHLERFMATDPLAVYALAHIYQWKDEAIAAAKYSLKFPLRAFDTSPPSGLKDLPAAAYYNLLHYHRRCSVVAHETTDTLKWLPSPKAQGFWMCCPSCYDEKSIWQFADGGDRGAPKGFAEYFQRMGAILKVTPGINPEGHPLFYEALNKVTCRRCEHFNKLVHFVTREWAVEIKTQIDKIELVF
ncbi:hypothetical protein B0H11DRAFT_2053116 [Mycena galericulata]|nr:hypothetical protein B0H11DRAFT_2053116 [Mycena galericulata]